MNQKFSYIISKIKQFYKLFIRKSENEKLLLENFGKKGKDIKPIIADNRKRI